MQTIRFFIYMYDTVCHERFRPAFRGMKILHHFSSSI